MIQTKQEAVSILTDTQYTIFEREVAIHFLDEQVLEKAEIDALVSVLRDDSAGVRWAAGKALAARGKRVLPTLLHELAKPNCNTLLRSSIHHILHDNASNDVRKASQELLEALKGPASDMATMRTAIQWLQKLGVGESDSFP